jgi:hypothetical protein
MRKPKLSIAGIRDRARNASRGSLPPAGVDPDAPPEPGPDQRDRRAIRQRLRRTRAVRRARVSELGALVAEMQSRGRWNQDLVDGWVRELDADDAEVRGLGQALRGDVALDDLIALRLVARCGACGRIGGSGDTFCTGCGRELARTAEPAGESGDRGEQTLVGEDAEATRALTQPRPGTSTLHDEGGQQITTIQAPPA